MLADKPFCALAQVLSAGVTRVAQHPAGVAGKPEFDLIDPARVQWREVEVKPLAVSRVERLPDGLGAMRIEVIPDHMHRFARVRGCHAFHESDQIVLGAPLAALGEHLPGMHIERGNQRLGAVTNIFEFTTTQPSRRGRSSRVLALDGLNTSLLVDTGHHRVSRCLAVQLANPVDLLAKGRVWTVQPLLDPVWSYVAGLQNALHVAAADLLDDAPLHSARRNLVERRRDPSLRFLRFTRQRNQLQSRFVRDAWRPTTARTLANALGTLPGNALAPLANRLYGYPQVPARSLYWRGLVGPQRDARPHHISLCSRLLLDQRKQFLSFFVRQLHWRCMATSAHPAMIIEAAIYSTYLRDVALVLRSYISYRTYNI